MTLFDFYNYKTVGFEISDSPTKPIEEIAKVAYEQYMVAISKEQEEKGMILE